MRAPVSLILLNDIGFDEFDVHIFKMSPQENVSRIVVKTKELLERLKIAVKHQSNLTIECTDSTIEELTRTVENLKSTCEKQEKELQNLKKQTEEAKLRLNLSFEESQALKEKNLTLRQKQDVYRNQLQTINQSQLDLAALDSKLRISKWITGVRFNPPLEENLMSGYVAIAARDAPRNDFIPFEFHNEDANKREIIWKTMEETCNKMKK